MDLAAFTRLIDERLQTRSLAWGRSEARAEVVAVVGGSAANEWIAARRAGADVLVTGEVPQHVALEASEEGFAIVAAGHYATETLGVQALASHLAERFDLDWEFHDHPTGL